MHEGEATEISGWTVEQRVSPDGQLMQGDLIAFEHQDRLRKLGLVVTADCDLLQRKHARLVTLVPVVEIEDIVECYLLPELCERNRAAITAFVARTFQVSSTLEHAEDVEDLRLKISAADGEPTLKSACIAARFLIHDVEQLAVQDYRNIIQASGLSVGKLEQRIEQQMRAKGDILILPKLSHIGILADIAWVRQIWQVPLKDIVFRASQLQQGRGQRVARLDSPYKYRLTQVLSQVFSDIGLPDVKRDLMSELNLVLS